MFIKDLPKSWRSLAFKPARPKPLSEWEKGLAWGMAISPCATVFFGYLALAGTEETFGAVGFVIVSIIAELVCIMVSVSIVLDKTTDQNPFRDAAGRQGTRNASPRPVDADRADAWHRAPPDTPDAGTHGSRVQWSGTPSCRWLAASFGGERRN